MTILDRGVCVATISIYQPFVNLTQSRVFSWTWGPGNIVPQHRNGLQNVPGLPSATRKVYRLTGKVWTPFSLPAIHRANNFTHIPTYGSPRLL